MSQLPDPGPRGRAEGLRSFIAEHTWIFVAAITILCAALWLAGILLRWPNMHIRS